MEIAFTICSNNYLAQAVSLAESFLMFHPNYFFKIALVDKEIAGEKNIQSDKIEIIPVSILNIERFAELVEKYNITELNTSVKPSYFKYIFQNYNANKVIYLDPDILVFSSFDELDVILSEKNIVVTPHILTPIDDEYAPTDYHTLRGGVFNLGFIALSNYKQVSFFLDWWHDRVIKYGFADFSRSMFYDQLWLNYLPVLFDNYHILKHPGYNMANWNLHERVLDSKDSAWFVNKYYPLRFFHFSGYKLTQPEILCNYNTRFDFNNRSDVKPVFDKYYQDVIATQWSYWHEVKCFYSKPILVEKKSFFKRLMHRLNLIGRVVVKGY